MDKIRLLIVDDHPVVGEGLQIFLDQDPGLIVLATAKDGQGGLEKLKSLNPDLVLLDLSLSQLEGCQAIRLFLDARPQIKILVFSAHTEEKYVYQALQAGASGYVVKQASTKELIQAIYYVMQGGYWVSPQFSPNLVAKYLKNLTVDDPEKSAFESLTDREQEVFRLIVAGKETKEIGQILCISKTTVAKHRISLIGKLNMKNSIELTKFAIRNGLIDP